MNINKFTSKNKDKYFSILLFVFLWVLQIIVIVNAYPKGFSFGFEYGKVATSLLNGNGFANSWAGDTGYTAAVMPVLVYLHYGLFILFGKSLTTYIIFSLLQISCYAFSYFFIVKSLKLNDIKLNYTIFSGLFLLFIGFSFTSNFKQTGDLWVCVFLISWFLYALSNHFKFSRKVGIINLSAFYLISPLINPAIALAGLSVFGLQSMFFLIQEIKGANYSSRSNLLEILSIKKYKIYFLNVLIFSVLFSIPILIWSYRNYQVFDKFVPTKSNLWMEYYVTNIHDDDGLLSYSSVVKHHPNNNDSIRNVIRKKGEVAAMEDFKIIGKLHMKENRKLFYKNILNRVVNSFIYTEYDMDIEVAKSIESFSPNDKLFLRNEKLIVGENWTCLDLSDEEFRNIIIKNELVEKQLVIDDWKNAKRMYYAKKNAPLIILRGLFMGIISTLAAIFLLLKTRGRNNLLIQSSIIFYIIYIVPYILFSHQLRYERPLFAINLILIYCFIYYYFGKFNFKRFKLKWTD